MVFGTCYCNFSVPEVGEDLFTVFRHNNIQTELMQQEKCCGMPKLELGDLESVKKAKEYKKKNRSIIKKIKSLFMQDE